MEGRYCRVEPLDLDRHVAQLHAANTASDDDRRWTYLSAEGFADVDSYRQWLRRDVGRRRFALPRHRRRRLRPRRRRGGLPADRSRQRRDRGRTYQLLVAAAADSGGHRGDVPDDAAGLRRAGLPPLRVEVRQPQRTVASCRGAARVPVRGDLPPGGRLQGPQPGHRVVLDPRRRVAGGSQWRSSNGSRPTTSTMRGVSGGLLPS